MSNLGRPSLVLVLAVLLFVAACGREGAAGGAEVRAVVACPPERCISVRDAEAVLGFDVLEPATLPRDFSLFTREFVENLAPDAPVPGSVGTAIPLGPPSGIQTEFRFRGSVALPGITLLQSAIGGEGAAVLALAGEDCGEMFSTESGPAFYVHGTYLVEETELSGKWVVCKDESLPLRDIHNVVAIRDGVLIEVIAFPEVRVSKEDVIALVKSLRPAE